MIRGIMRFKRGRETVLAGPGETVIVPAGTAHRFANAGDALRDTSDTAALAFP